jgi:2-succinyl-5-enolpyruvyl-6-hydroxy-3-cyclohexene-1-carboxylate synthase
MSDISPLLKCLAPFSRNPPEPVAFDSPDDIRVCDVCDSRVIAYFARSVTTVRSRGERTLILCRRCLSIAQVLQRISG